MRSAEQDQRVYKTQKLIRSAVTEFMKTKSIKEISVREITEKVHISRGTFYLHYKDVFDLVEKIEQDILVTFNQILDKVYANPDDSLLLMMQEIFNFISQNADICTVLLSEKGDIAFLEKLKMLIKERAISFWQESHIGYDMKLFNYHMNFIIAGASGILQEWLSSGMKETPKEMAILTDRMIREGSSILSIYSSNEK